MKLSHYLSRIVCFAEPAPVRCRISRRAPVLDPGHPECDRGSQDQPQEARKEAAEAARREVARPQHLISGEAQLHTQNPVVCMHTYAGIMFLKLIADIFLK